MQKFDKIKNCVIDDMIGTRKTTTVHHATNLYENNVKRKK